MKEVTSFEYNLNSKALELYDSNGEHICDINPLKIIKEAIEPKACYLISNQDEFVTFSKQGSELMNIPVWETIQIWQEKKLTEKYLGEG